MAVTESASISGPGGAGRLARESMAPRSLTRQWASLQHLQRGGTPSGPGPDDRYVVQHRQLMPRHQPSNARGGGV